MSIRLVEGGLAMVAGQSCIAGPSGCFCAFHIRGRCGPHQPFCNRGNKKKAPLEAACWRSASASASRGGTDARHASGAPPPCRGYSTIARRREQAFCGPPTTSCPAFAEAPAPAGCPAPGKSAPCGERLPSQKPGSGVQPPRRFCVASFQRLTGVRTCLTRHDATSGAACAGGHV